MSTVRTAPAVLTLSTVRTFATVIFIGYFTLATYSDVNEIQEGISSALAGGTIVIARWNPDFLGDCSVHDGAVDRAQPAREPISASLTRDPKHLGPGVLLRLGLG